MVLIVGQNSVWQNTYNLTSLELGTVNRINRVFAWAAGKGSNVARALGFLECESLLLAYVGGPNGDKFRRACDEDGIRSDFTAIGGETRICTTIIEDAGRITEVVEPAPAVTAAEREAFTHCFQKHIGSASLLVVSGTAMVGEREACYYEFVRTAREQGIPVVLDSYRNHGRRALDAGPDVLKINADELAELSAMNCTTPGGRLAAAESIMKRFGVRWIVITRGKEGAEAYDGSRSLTALPPSVNLVNAIGSGDSFTAGLVAALLSARRTADRDTEPGFPRGASLADALKTGTSMGTANCMNIKPGHIDRSDFAAVDGAVEVADIRP